MKTLSRDDLIAEALPLVEWQAGRFSKLPRGINRDDLVSAGNEALIHAATCFDPDGAAGWKTYARACVKNAMRAVIATARTRRAVGLDVRCQGAGGEVEMRPRVDVKQPDPADVAAARELLDPPPANLIRRRNHATVSTRELARVLPSPAEVADRVTRLREAMFGAISEADIQAVMAGIVDRAKTGSRGDAKLLIDLLAPARSGVTVHQSVQSVVIQHEDVA